MFIDRWEQMHHKTNSTQYTQEYCIYVLSQSVVIMVTKCSSIILVPGSLIALTFCFNFLKVSFILAFAIFNKDIYLFLLWSLWLVKENLHTYVCQLKASRNGRVQYKILNLWYIDMLSWQFSWEIFHHETQAKGIKEIKVKKNEL